MKKRKLISIILALLLALQWITPAMALEGDVPPEPGEAVEAPEVLPEELRLISVWQEWTIWSVDTPPSMSTSRP